MKRFMAVMLGVCLALEAFAAGSASNVRIVAIRVDSSGKGVITFDQPMGGTPPGCVVSAYTSALAFNNDDGGKAVLALALSARAMDRPLSIIGRGTCANFNGFIEDVDYAVML
jgi:hypothetical protein